MQFVGRFVLVIKDRTVDLLPLNRVIEMIVETVIKDFKRGDQIVINCFLEKNLPCRVKVFTDDQVIAQ